MHTLLGVFWSLTKIQGIEILHLCISNVIFLTDNNTVYTYRISTKKRRMYVSDYLTSSPIWAQFAEYYEIYHHSYSLIRHCFARQPAISQNCLV